MYSRVSAIVLLEIMTRGRESRTYSKHDLSPREVNINIKTHIQRQLRQPCSCVGILHADGEGGGKTHIPLNFQFTRHERFLGVDLALGLHITVR